MRRPEGSPLAMPRTPHDSAQSNLAPTASTSWLYLTHKNLGCTPGNTTNCKLPDSVVQLFATRTTAAAALPQLQTNLKRIIMT